MADTEVKKHEDQSIQTAQSPRTETVYIPDVDISEGSDGIRLIADMPGVDQKSVEVTVENNVLTIEGNARVEPPKGYKLAGQEYGVGKYRRDFTLSNEVDTDGIKARVRHGVLELTIPKREEGQIKQKAITIESG